MPLLTTTQFVADVLGSFWPFLAYWLVNRDNYALDPVFYTELSPATAPDLSCGFRHFLYLQIAWTLAVMLALSILLENHNNFCRNVCHEGASSTMTVELALTRNFSRVYCKCISTRLTPAVSQFRRHSDTDQLCSYYMKSFHEPLSSRNKLIDEIARNKNRSASFIHKLYSLRNQTVKSIIQKSTRTRTLSTCQTEKRRRFYSVYSLGTVLNSISSQAFRTRLIQRALHSQSQLRKPDRTPKPVRAVGEIGDFDATGLPRQART